MPTAATATPTDGKTKPATKKATKYPDWMADAVRRSRVISGKKPGPDGKPLGDKTLNYPGPKQHLFIRKTISEKLDGQVTPDAILKLTGIKSHKLLRGVAEWSADKSEMKPLRPLSRDCNDDTGWSTGRYLASAIVAWIDQLRAEAKRA